MVYVTKTHGVLDHSKYFQSETWNIIILGTFRENNKSDGGIETVIVIDNDFIQLTLSFMYEPDIFHEGKRELKQHIQIPVSQC